MKVLFQNQQWKVNEDFTIVSKDLFYEITTDILNVCDWSVLLQEKNWVKINLFNEALNFVKSKLKING